MAQKLTGSLPPGMDLEFTYTVQWAALDPGTGAPVAAVVVSDAAMLVDQVSPGTDADLSSGAFVPLLTPIAIEDQQAAAEAAQGNAAGDGSDQGGDEVNA